MDKHTYCITLSLTFVGPFLLIQGKLICPICQLHDWYHLGYFLDSMPSSFLINAFLGLCVLFVVVACSFEPWWSWDANSHLRMKTKELIRNSIRKVWLLDFRHYCREIGQDLSCFLFFFFWPPRFNLYGFYSLGPVSSEKSGSWCFERQVVENVWEAHCLAFALSGKSCVSSKIPCLFHHCFSLCLISWSFSSWWVVCLTFFFFFLSLIWNHPNNLILFFFLISFLPSLLSSFISKCIFFFMFCHQIVKTPRQIEAIS